MPTRRRAVLVLALLTALGIANFAAALAVGSISIHPSQVLAALLGENVEQVSIVRDLRLPRALAAFA